MIKNCMFTWPLILKFDLSLLLLYMSKVIHLYPSHQMTLSLKFQAEVMADKWHISPKFKNLWPFRLTFHPYNLGEMAINICPSHQIVVPVDIPSWSYGNNFFSLCKIVTFDLENLPFTSLVLWKYSLYKSILCKCYILFPLNIPSQGYGWKIEFLANNHWPLTFDLQHIYISFSM